MTEMQQLDLLQKYIHGYFDRNSPNKRSHELKNALLKAEVVVRNLGAADTALPSPTEEQDLLLDFDQEMAPSSKFEKEEANEIDILVSRIKTLAQKKDTTFSLTFNSYMRHTEKHLEHALDCASRAGMELSELIAPMTAQVDLASNNLFRVHLAELLRTLDEHYEALADRANEERRKGAEATEDGEVACTKAHSYAQAELLEQMTDLLDRQFEVLDEESSFQDKQTAAAEYNLAALDRSLTVFFDRMKARESALQAELARLDAAMARKNEAESRCLAAEDVEEKWRARFLQESTDRAATIWAEIARLEAELRALSDQQVEQLRARARASAQLQERQAVVREYTDFYTSRRQALQDQLAAVDNGRAAAHQMREAAHTIMKGFTNAYRQKGKLEMEEGYKRVSQQQFAEFRRLHLLLGELQFRNEKQADILRRGTETAAIHLEIATDTLDPLGKKHADDAKAMQPLLVTLESERQVLRQQQMKAVQRIARSEKLLMHYGLLPTIRPQQELADLMITKGEKLLLYHELKATHSVPSPIRCQTPDTPKARRRLTQLANSYPSPFSSTSCGLTMSPSSAPSTPSPMKLDPLPLDASYVRRGSSGSVSPGSFLHPMPQPLPSV